MADQADQSHTQGIQQENSGNETLNFIDQIKAGGAALETLRALARNNPQAAFALHNYEIKHTERGTALKHSPTPHSHSKLGRSGR